MATDQPVDAAAAPLLEVTDLQVQVATRWGVVRAVDGVSFALRPGETLGLVGESGSGKTMTCLALLRLLPSGGKIVGGQVKFAWQDLLRLSERAMRTYRGRHLSMILQDPLSSLNPVFTIGEQIAESLRIHRVVPRQGVRGRILELLRAVQIPVPERRVNQYPHMFSGGMRQRVAGAIALAPSPQVLIADEPTTSLDVTIQLQYLKWLKEIQRQNGLAIIFVTHDMGIIARMCDRVAVMYAGKLVEDGPVERILERPAHPYTEALVQSLPKLHHRLGRLPSIEGEPPDMRQPPPGCPFQPRCPKALEVCSAEFPPTVHLPDAGGSVACWLHSAGVAEPLAARVSEGSRR